MSNQFNHILRDQIDTVCKKLYEMGRDDLALLFTKCYPNTLETTTKLLDDGSAFVITGDIHAMFLTDTNDLNVFLGKAAVSARKGARLTCAAGGIVLGIEVQYYLFASKIRERNVISVLVLQGKIRRFSSDL